MADEQKLRQQLEATRRPEEQTYQRRDRSFSGNQPSRYGNDDRFGGQNKRRRMDRGFRPGGFSDEPQAPTPREVIELGLVEKTELFRIELANPFQSFPLDHPDLGLRPVADPARMREAGYLPTETVDELWRNKSRMDSVFDSGKSAIYYSKRDTYFPLDRRGSVQFRNRAGDKLWQVHEAVNLFEGVSGPSRFIDVCGGPGAFSQLLLDKAPQPAYGYGMTLEDETTPPSEKWYHDLRSHSRFTICTGQDGSGNVYKPENLDHMAKLIAFEQGGVLIAVSDGGFEIKKDSEGNHAENFQELYSTRIVLSELLAAMKVLERGGHFVCKLFDSLSDFTQSLIFLTAHLFEHCFIVKPLRSRIINSERYLVGKKLKKDENFAFIVKVLHHIHASFKDDLTPLSAVPLNIVKSDPAFLKSSSEMLEKIAKKQIGSLDLVMTAVENEIKGEDPATLAADEDRNRPSDGGVSQVEVEMTDA